MRIRKLAMAFFALVVLLASPVAYASNGETDSGTSFVDTQCIYLPDYFWFSNLPGLYTWVDNTTSDRSIERGYFLRLGQCQLCLPVLAASVIGWDMFSGGATYGTYTRNLSDSIDSAQFITVYEGSWYPISADVLHLRLRDNNYWIDPILPFPWMQSYDVFNGNVHVDIQWQGLNRLATISLFGHDLAKTLPWFYLPIIADTDACLQSNGA